MDFRILVERECTRLSCINLTPQNLEALNNFTNKLYQVSNDAFVEAVFQYHKCIVEISGNKAYLMIFQSFEKMIHNLIAKHFLSSNNITSLKLLSPPPLELTWPVPFFPRQKSHNFRDFVAFRNLLC